MVEEKNVIEKIVQKGRDFIIVGRNADLLLKEYNPLNIFVCADLESKVQRCIDKALIGENVTQKEIDTLVNFLSNREFVSNEVLSQEQA